MIKYLEILAFCILLMLKPSLSITAQQLQSDNGDGTYTNPVIYSDYPDPDVIRVDSVYYMVSTTMFVFPGVTILKSYDLVNWEYCSNAVQRFDFSPCYDLDSCNRYAHGQWATSLKYHNGTFYLLFITLDEGGFVCTTENPEGDWDITHLPRGFYDPGLFFDDDGKIYVAHGYSNIYITELDSNLTAVDNDTLVFTGDIRSGLEGTHVYKINGYYYLYCTYGGGDGFQVALRSANIYGPYEEKIVIQDNGNLGTGIHQGALVETQTGEWWSVIFQDGGAFGRFPTLQPVTWEDDWPMVGVNGKGVVTYPKPDVGKDHPVKTLPTSDEFDSTELGMQWGWNHNPDSNNWSLTKNPGYLRLSAAKVVTNLRDARNTLTQRIFAYYSREVGTMGTIKMNVDSIQEGDIAGIAVFQDPYAYIGVKKTGGSNYIIMVNNGEPIDSVISDSSVVYLRANASYGTSTTSFSYSLDNELFTKLGNDLSMRFNLSIFTGNKFCLFNYPTSATGGFVDFDWFRTDMCTKTTVVPKLQVNDGALLDTNKVTINLGDSVILAPEALGEGTWRWNYCGITELDAPVQTVYPTSNCIASASFTNECGYKTDIIYYIYVNNPATIRDIQVNSELKIYPNPGREEIKVIWDAEFSHLLVYNIDGQELLDLNYQVPQKSVDIPVCFSPGVYVVKVMNDSSYRLNKLIIE